MSTLPCKVHIVIILLFLSLGLFACGRKLPATFPTDLPTRDIFPYHTPTAIKITPSPVIFSLIPAIPDPTQTPFVHIIEKGETMLGIALRYGIALEALQVANPDADPNMLSVGSQLIIPLDEDLQGVFFTPTPIPIALGTPDCYRTTDGGAWCFVIVENHYPYALEDVSARIELYSEQDNHNLEGTAFAPLNRIGPGKKLPLVYFFSPPIPSIISTKTELVTAVAIAEDSTRYINGEVAIDELTINSNAKSATVRGRVLFPDSVEYPGQVWLVAIAYGEDGNVVGFRKWEAVFPGRDPIPISPSTTEAITAVTPFSILPVNFDMMVYSLGPEIKQVEVIIEAHP